MYFGIKWNRTIFSCSISLSTRKMHEKYYAGMKNQHRFAFQCKQKGPQAPSKKDRFYFNLYRILSHLQLKLVSHSWINLRNYVAVSKLSCMVFAILSQIQLDKQISEVCVFECARLLVHHFYALWWCWITWLELVPFNNIRKVHEVFLLCSFLIVLPLLTVLIMQCDGFKIWSNTTENYLNLNFITCCTSWYMRMSSHGWITGQSHLMVTPSH